MSEARAPSLSVRQARALALVAQGWSFGEIGRHLKIAPRIVLLYMMHLQRYLGTANPGDLITLLMKAQLLPLRWARAQTRPRRPRKPTPAPSPAPPPESPPEGDPGGGPA
jgi:DNA-binding CsgD family transcriptional regulator